MHPPEAREASAPREVRASSVRTMWTSVQEDGPLEGAHAEDPQDDLGLAEVEQFSDL